MNKIGAKKAQKFNLIYNGLKVKHIKNGKKKRLRVVTADIKYKTQENLEKSETTQHSNVVDFKVLKRSKDDKEELHVPPVPKKKAGSIKKVIFGVSLFAMPIIAGRVGIPLYYGYPLIPTYTQVGEMFNNKTHSLEYEVIAKKQKDVTWIGYELNGLTNKGWWYQESLTNYGNDKFNLIYNVYNQNTKLIYEGAVDFSKKVNENDKIKMHLSISKGRVSMFAEDLNNGGTAEISFNAVGDIFSGSENKGQFTGLMTETYSELNFKPQQLSYQSYVNMSKKQVDGLVFEDRFVAIPTFTNEMWRLSYTGLNKSQFKDFLVPVSTSAEMIHLNKTYVDSSSNFFITTGQDIYQDNPQ